MSIPKHATWGRPLTICLEDCNSAGSTKFKVPEQTLVDLILESIEKIGAGEHVSNGILETILFLPRMPSMVGILDDPAFMKGCLKIACEPQARHIRRSSVTPIRSFSQHSSNFTFQQSMLCPIAFSV